ncbi:hypothetical protein OHA74_52310 [Streptomyces phaeochromogenes]|uniref:hypothetical protein n=1 Tax=Streptomyces phaeochromogenes TaxID=1923 RepID=UPI002E2B30D5|nr:hypothetical protein [Streptomyces phaeochromogenes]
MHADRHACDPYVRACADSSRTWAQRANGLTVRPDRPDGGDLHPQLGGQAPAGAIATAPSWPGMNARTRPAAWGRRSGTPPPTACCDSTSTAALSTAVTGGCRTPG